MKILHCIAALALLLSSCQQKKARQHQDAVNEMMEKYGEDKTGLPQPDAKAPSDEIIKSGLMGEWEAVLVTGDHNSNGILDPEEREKGFTTYQSYLRFKPDGTCEFTISRNKAVYEIVEKNGHKSIEIIVSDGSRISQGRIISLQPDELQLMKFSGGRDIIVYHRP